MYDESHATQRTPWTFGESLQIEARSAASADIARTDQGRAFGAALSVDPMRLLRFPSYAFGVGARLSTASEFSELRVDPGKHPRSPAPFDA